MKRAGKYALSVKNEPHGYGRGHLEAAFEAGARTAAREAFGSGDAAYSVERVDVWLAVDTERDKLADRMIELVDTARRLGMTDSELELLLTRTLRGTA